MLITSVRHRNQWKRCLTTLAVLTGLGGFGWWEHSRHETLPAPAAPLRASDPTISAHEPTDARITAATKSATIELRSSQLVEQLGIEMVEVCQRPMTRELSVAASVAYQSGHVAQLTSRVPGIVWRTERLVGQSIKKGEVLAIVDSMQVGSAKADLLMALAELELKQKQATRLHNLQPDTVPRKQVEEIDAELRKAQVRMFNSQQTLVNLGLPVDAAHLNGLSHEELLRRVKFLGLPEPLVAGLDPQNTTANLLPICSPFDGVVIGQDLAIGEVVASDKRSFEVADISRMWIRLNVREDDAPWLRLGQPVIFSVGDAQVRTAISWISTALDPRTRTVEVRCDTENRQSVDESGKPTGNPVLRANAFGTARICVEQRTEATAVPTAALQSSDRGPIVFVRNGAASFTAHVVRTGIADEEYTELVEGVQPGQFVAGVGSHVLQSELRRRQPAETKTSRKAPLKAAHERLVGVPADR